MRLLISGSREWTNRQEIKDRLSDVLYDIEVLIHGDCRGADRIAEEVAIELGLPRTKIMAIPARWSRDGRAAGPIRNRVMLLAKPTHLWAFNEDMTKSTGTKDMYKIAFAAGLDCWCSDEQWSAHDGDTSVSRRKQSSLVLE